MIVAACGVLVNAVMACILHGSGHGHSHGAASHSHGEHGHSHKEHGHSHGNKYVEVPGSPESEHSFADGDSVSLQVRLLSEKSPKVNRRKLDRENLNLRAAMIHVIGDLLQSVGVLVAAGLIWWKPEWKIADPICTFLFSILVLLTTVRIVRESFHVLMEGTPEGIDLLDVSHVLKGLHQVDNVHDLHIWSIKIGRPALSVHLRILPEADDALVLRQAQELLLNAFNICHSTIQIERAAISSSPKKSTTAL